MTDPRADNCKGYATDASGRVTGVELEVREIPSAPYKLISVQLIDEASAGGNTVATCVVLDARGIPTAENVWLAWPWPWPGPPWDDISLPGNPNNQHMITNGFDPALGLGPLALYVGDADGNPLSDIVGGLGLPYNRHVSYRATWVARGEPDTGPVDAGTEALERIADALERLDMTVQRLAEHFGAWAGDR